MKVCIAGGGRVGMYLAQSLLSHRHKVTIIEPQESLCRTLADTLDIPVICGDSLSFDTLRTADVASCDAFVAVTNTDETNLVACQIAKREFGVNRTVARASNPKNRDILHTLGVDTVVCGTDNLSHILEREIETDTIRQLLSLGGGTASLNEILLPEDFQFAGKEIKEIPIPGDAILVSITRDTEFIIPHSATSAAHRMQKTAPAHTLCQKAKGAQTSPGTAAQTQTTRRARGGSTSAVRSSSCSLICGRKDPTHPSADAGCRPVSGRAAADSVTVQSGVAVPVLRRIPRRAVTGVQLLRTPLLWAAGCTVLLVRSPGLQLVLPGIPASARRARSSRTPSRQLTCTVPSASTCQRPP